VSCVWKKLTLRGGRENSEFKASIFHCGFLGLGGQRAEIQSKSLFSKRPQEQAAIQILRESRPNRSPGWNFFQQKNLKFQRSTLGQKNKKS
jgi:hypothetical protein